MTRCRFCIGALALPAGAAAGGSAAQGIALVPEAGVVVWRDRIASHCLHAHVHSSSHLAPAYHCNVNRTLSPVPSQDY